MSEILPTPRSRTVVVQSYFIFFHVAGGSSSAVQKPKKAPLMQKALAAIKNRFRRQLIPNRSLNVISLSYLFSFCAQLHIYGIFINCIICHYLVCFVSFHLPFYVCPFCCSTVETMCFYSVFRIVCKMLVVRKQCFRNTNCLCLQHFIQFTFTCRNGENATRL